jgi:uncharacterized repeat protein (TIGR03803 family)
MPRQPQSSHFKLAFLGMIAIAVSANQVFASGQPRETVLYNFAGLPDGRYPVTRLLMDEKAGALFGTTGWGGTGNCPYSYPSASAALSAGYQPRGCGTVFKLTPPAAGQTEWRETVLYSFTSGGVPNEFSANPSGLIADSSGVLYGTTTSGGTHGVGTVFALSPPAPGEPAWRHTTLANLASRLGGSPYAELIMDSSGTLYGTTSAGGAHGVGTVFALVPARAGWTLSQVFDFAGKNGNDPGAGLIMDKTGALYGTTVLGGAHNLGEVFRVARSPLASWQETTLFNFAAKVGAFPQAPLIMDASGNLYGTTSGAAPYNGTVFKLSPSGSGWKETVLLAFRFADGAAPTAGLIMDARGALYGTTSGGGTYGKGTVFRLSPPAEDRTAWTLTVLHDFNGKDGATPGAPLIMDDTGAPCTGPPSGAARTNSAWYSK